MPRFSIVKRLPSGDEYRALCRAVGWSGLIDCSRAEKALSGSLYGITVLDESGGIIGMGRIIGDGGLYFYIHDVAVHPDYRDRGIEPALMKDLTDYLEENAPPGSFIVILPSPEDVGILDQSVRA